MKTTNKQDCMQAEAPVDTYTGARAVPGSQRPKGRSESRICSALVAQPTTLRAEDGSRSDRLDCFHRPVAGPRCILPAKKFAILSGCPPRLVPFVISILLFCGMLAGLVGCGGGASQKPNRDFFTSGSREADQRASQRMAKEEQLTGTGEGAGEKGVKKAKATGAAETSSGEGTNRAAQAEGKLSLFERLGGEAGVSNIVADFTQRALQDPRVDWQRKDVKGPSRLFHRGQSVGWDATTGNVMVLEAHLIQFLALATGGPAHYDGKEIKSAHANMHIANPEFDAAIGDLKVTLDKLKIPNKEQKELLAIVESTRPLIVTER